VLSFQIAYALNTKFVTLPAGAGIASWTFQAATATTGRQAVVQHRFDLHAWRTAAPACVVRHAWRYLPFCPRWL